MACGLPVLASDNGGLPEIIVDPSHGLLRKPGDIAAWRQGILSMLVADLPGMGRAARQRATEHFTWAANAARLEDTLCE
jgi:glycosyltransferase involved in cell wall biosynthesis